MEGFIRIAVLYLTILTPEGNHFVPSLHPISKYMQYDQCNTHKKYVIRSMKKKGEYTKDMIFFCTNINYNPNDTTKFDYLSELPFCSKSNSKYHCGYVY